MPNIHNNIQPLSKMAGAFNQTSRNEHCQQTADQLGAYLADLAARLSARHNVYVGVHRLDNIKNLDYRLSLYVNLALDGNGQPNPCFARWAAACDRAAERGVPANCIARAYVPCRAGLVTEEDVSVNCDGSIHGYATLPYTDARKADTIRPLAHDDCHSFVRLEKISIDVTEDGKPWSIETYLLDNGRRRKWDYRNSESNFPVAVFTRVTEEHVHRLAKQLREYVVRAEELDSFDVAAHNAAKERRQALRDEAERLDAEIAEAIERINQNVEGVHLSNRGSWGFENSSIELKVEKHDRDEDDYGNRRRRTLLRIIRNIRVDCK